MKTALVFTVVSSLLLPAGLLADETHDADRGLESMLRSEITDRHVHIHVHHGIVTVDGHVRTDVDRQRIDALVRNTTGVVALKDELKVDLPSPGTYGAAPAGVAIAPGSVPVYTGPLPDLVPAAPVVTSPAPVIIPEFPKIKVQAWSPQDVPMAHRIAEQLRADAVPTTGVENVRIVVRDGNVSLKGDLDTHRDRDALISSVQRVTGVTAIYDQLQIK